MLPTLTKLATAEASGAAEAKAAKPEVTEAEATMPPLLAEAEAAETEVAGAAEAAGVEAGVDLPKKAENAAAALQPSMVWLGSVFL